MDTTPTLAGFVTFCRTVAGINSTVMPDNDPGFDRAFTLAQEWIPCELAQISAIFFTDCTYSWGVSIILQQQLDQTGQTFFADMRAAYGVNNLVPGVITSDADESTSTTLTTGKSLSNLSLTDLQRIKDPFGRQAIAYLMDMGTLWGLS
jgi:hypothetical protein